MRRSNVITEGAMAAALFVVLLLLSVLVPVLNILLVWFLPIPFIIFVIRNGWRPGVMLALAAIVVASLVIGVTGLIFALMFGTGGIVAGLLYRQKRSAFAVLLGGGLAYTTSMIVVFGLLIWLLGVNLIEQNIQLLTQAIDQAQSMSQLPVTGDVSPFEVMKKQIEMLRYFAPMLFVLSGAVYALVSQLVSTPILKRFGLGAYVPEWLPFRQWLFPKSMIWYYLIVLVIKFLEDFSPGSAWFIMYYNIFMFLSLIMLIQGYAFIFYFAHQKHWHKSIPVLILISSFLLSVLFPFITLVIFLGILDIGLDLRNRMHSH